MSRIVAVGIDPGLANMAIAAIALEQGSEIPKLLEVSVVPTKGVPAKLRTKQKIRASHDDARRMHEQWQVLSDWLGRHEPDVVGVEHYTVGRAKAGGAWKTVQSYQNVLVACWERGIKVVPFLPLDLKMLTGTRKASKPEVQQAVCNAVSGLARELGCNRPSAYEHLADATGCAFLALRSRL